MKRLFIPLLLGALCVGLLLSAVANVNTRNRNIDGDQVAVSMDKDTIGDCLGVGWKHEQTVSAKFTTADVGWKKGPLPAGTWFYGGVILVRHEPGEGFKLASFCGDYARLPMEQNRVVHAEEIAYYNNGIDWPVPREVQGQAVEKHGPARPIIRPAILKTVVDSTKRSDTAKWLNGMKARDLSSPPTIWIDCEASKVAGRSIFQLASALTPLADSVAAVSTPAPAAPSGSCTAAGGCSSGGKATGFVGKLFKGSARRQARRAARR